MKMLKLLAIIMFLFGCTRTYNVAIYNIGTGHTVSITVKADVPIEVTTDADIPISVVP